MRKLFTSDGHTETNERPNVPCRKIKHGEKLLAGDLVNYNTVPGDKPDWQTTTDIGTEHKSTLLEHWRPLEIPDMRVSAAALLNQAATPAEQHIIARVLKELAVTAQDFAAGALLRDIEKFAE